MVLELFKTAARREKILNKIINAAPILFVLLGLGACISEPLARNCVRIIFLIFFAALCYRKFSLKDFTPYAKILFLMAAFLAWLMISYALGGMKIPLGDDAIEWLAFSHNMIIFLPLAVLIREEKFLTAILTALGLSLMIDNAYIFWQAAQGVERPLTFLHGAIMQSTLLYIILLPAFLVMMLREQATLPRRLFDGIIFFTSLAACIMINTRGAWLDLAIVLPFIVAYRLRSRKKILAAAVICVVLGGLFLAASPRTFNRLSTIAAPSAEQSVSERFLMWRSALSAIGDQPLTGVGFGNYEAAYREKYISDEARERFQGHAHNVYLQLWAEAGLPGLILFCGLFGYILYWSWRRAKNFYGLIIFAATLDLMLYGLTDYTLSSFSAMRVYWLLFGVCLIGLRFKRA